MFSSAAAAARQVAGLPAAARALREAALAGEGTCIVAVPGGWQPRPAALAEMQRLAEGAAIAIVDTADLDAHGEPALLVHGESLVAAEVLQAALQTGTTSSRAVVFAPPGDWIRLPRLGAREAAKALDRAGRAIIAATAKPGDGIVSRFINRPISQTCSFFLLKWPGIRPIHGTVAAALTAIVMAACLVMGGHPGLIAGALLFQTASIVDGIDGELARATFRTSRGGAMADSLVDAVTNIGFIGGVAINLWIQGNGRAAIAGAIGLSLFALGLFLIGRRARQGKATFTFDGVKDHFRARNSWFSQWLIWLTMRDFFALAWVVVICGGAAAGGLVLFALIVSGWLVTVLYVLRRQAS